MFAKVHKARTFFADRTAVARFAKIASQLGGRLYGLVIHALVNYTKRMRRYLPQNRFGDRLFSLHQFLECHGRFPNDSRTYNDVLYRMKVTNEILYPLRVFVTDKEFVKLYIKALVDEHYNVPTIAVLRSAEEIDDYEFPADCCIKPTHSSGQVLFRENGAEVDRDRIKSWFKHNYYLSAREANYKTLKPKVIVEPLLFGKTSVDEYKFHCFQGTPKLIKAIADRYTNYRCLYFDNMWHEQKFSVNHERSVAPIPCPGNFKEMLGVAAALSANFSYIRIDLYSDGTRCYVGEITNCSDAATGKFIPPSGERLASDLIFRR